MSEGIVINAEKLYAMEANHLDTQLGNVMMAIQKSREARVRAKLPRLGQIMLNNLVREDVLRMEANAESIVLVLM